MAARIGGHPLHPALAHFPVALWTAAPVADAVGLWLDAPDAWVFGFWALAAGVAIGAAAMAAGALDFAALPGTHPARDTAVHHMLAMGSAWLLCVLALALRGWPPDTAPTVLAIAAELAGFATMALGGWLGGSLVYRFGIGLADAAAGDAATPTGHVDRNP